MYILSKTKPVEYAILLGIWESSVRATHKFLREEDIVFYKNMISEEQVFCHVDVTTVRNADNEILGFTGTAEDKLEMLFIKPHLRGTGMGKLLLQHALANLGVRKVDVNEQNESGLSFYEHFGFVVMSRSAVDATGKPFPILHLQLTGGHVTGERTI
jgi:putative acetyltransferase